MKINLFFVSIIVILLLIEQTNSIIKQDQQNFLIPEENQFLAQQLNALKNKPQNLFEQIVPAEVKLASFPSDVIQAQIANNLDVSSLIPAYKLFLQNEVLKQEVGDANLTGLAIQNFNLNLKNQRVSMPYDDLFKLGDGFNVSGNQVRASPFFLPAILQSQTITQQGQDGDIQIQVVQDSKQLASALAVKASVWGKGWGVSARADFSFSKSYSMQSNEVMLIATHTIDLGKDFVDPSNFRLTQNAQAVLATNQQEFLQNYGTHYIAGYSKQCSMSVFLKQQVSSSQSKMDVAASLKASYKGLSFSGGASVSAQFGQSSSDFNSNTDISIQYFGANNDAFIQGITVAQLNDAILSFPQHCVGNIYSYILWPYESCASYLDLKVRVESLLNLQKTQQTQLQIQQQQQKAANELNSQKFFQTGLDLIDDLFTESILQIRIDLAGLKNQNVSAAQLPQKNDAVWNMKLLEFQLNTKYNQYQNQITVMANATVLDINQQVNLIQQARAEVQTFMSTNVSSVLLKDNCVDSKCLKCEVLNPSNCRVCNSSLILNQYLCVQNCPLSYYKIQDLSQPSLAYMCAPCDSSCLQCNITATLCLSCNAASGLALQNSQCVSNCNSGTSAQNGVCLPCNPAQSLQPVSQIIGGSSTLYAIKGGNSNYQLYCSDQTIFRCNVQNWSAWEQFNIYLINNSTLSFASTKRSPQTYCSDRKAQNLPVACEATQVGSTEQFTFQVVDSSKGIFALKTTAYCTDNQASGVSCTNTNSRGSWDTYQFLTMQPNC